jgi:hypothetical protein
VKDETDPAETKSPKRQAVISRGCSDEHLVYRKSHVSPSVSSFRRGQEKHRIIVLTADRQSSSGTEGRLKMIFLSLMMA